MRLLTRDKAKTALAQIKSLGQIADLTQEQAIEAVELLDDLGYSYHKQANNSNDPSSEIRSAAKQLAETRDKMAVEWDICTCCYQPRSVCSCGREFDGWWDAEKLYINEDDINCWLD